MKRLILFLVLGGCFVILTVRAAQEKKKSVPSSASKEVAISNFQFTPKTLTIKTGGTVTWTIKEGTHTVTADDNGWESPTLNAGKTFEHQFTKPGIYPYHCSFHGSPGANMSGIVKVVR